MSCGDVATFASGGMRQCPTFKLDFVIKIRHDFIAHLKFKNNICMSYLIFFKWRKAFMGFGYVIYIYDKNSHIKIDSILYFIIFTLFSSITCNRRNRQNLIIALFQFSDFIFGYRIFRCILYKIVVFIAMCPFFAMANFFESLLIVETFLASAHKYSTHF